MDDLYLIVGLGNPGKEYARTRHNAGFLVLEHWAQKHQAPWKTEDGFRARLATVRLDPKKVVLCEPLTFMNVSGESVIKVARYYRVTLERTMVVVDDADLPLGQIRMRPSGSSGGHHGLDSVEQHLGTREYARLRIGIGRVASNQRDIAGHVLGKFSESEEPILRRVLDRSAQQLDCWLTDGIQKAMSTLNGAVSLE